MKNCEGVSLSLYLVVSSRDVGCLHREYHCISRTVKTLFDDNDNLEDSVKSHETTIIRTPELDWVRSTDMPVGDEVVLLEGEMLASPDSSPSKAGMSSSSSKIPELNLDTLDEPISETLMRDLTGIVTKVRHVILPTSKSDAYKSILKDWDLWVSFALSAT